MKVLMKDINKSFFNVPVLKDVDFNLKEGEVHALVGENGAGKSTLMKILTGIYTKDSGQILIDGKEVVIGNVKDSMNLEISFLHQELLTLPNMTIWENMFLGREIKNKFGILNTIEMKRIAREKLKEMSLDIDVDLSMGEISIGKQQLIEIAISLLWNKKIIILDEPTSALTNKEINTLFETIRRLQKEGVSFIYITHRLDEIFEIANRVTVLRDGEIIGTKNVKDVKINDIIKMMVGYTMHDRYPKSESKIGEIVLKVEGLTKEPLYRNVSFELRNGEVLGFAGLMGSGRTEIMQSIFGIIKIDKGKVFINDEEVHVKNTVIAKEKGLAYITENRKEEGLLLESSVSENIVLPNLRKILNKMMLIDEKKEEEMAKTWIDKLSIKADNTKIDVQTLSGGNQQKVVVGKWIATKPKILILDEPTRGVDVGAKYEIYEIINELKKSGVAIIMISSDLPEVLSMSDRIAVMHEGDLMGIVEKKDFSQEKIMTLATGGK